MRPVTREHPIYRVGIGPTDGSSHLAQFMCKGGTSKLDAKIETVALGCDGKGS